MEIFQIRIVGMGTIAKKMGKSFECEWETFFSREMKNISWYEWETFPSKMGNISQCEKCFPIHMGNMSYFYREMFLSPTGKPYTEGLDNMALWEVETFPFRMLES